MQWEKGGFLLTDDSDRLDRERTFALLNATYWGVRRPREVVERMVEHSLCFSLFLDGVQVGFARAVTDYTVFSWIADLVIDPPYRGRGIGRWMINCLVKRACAQAGLPQNGRYGSHTLRKSFAARVFRACGHDINVTRVALGHRDIATTQRYLEVAQEDVRSAILAVSA